MKDVSKGSKPRRQLTAKQKLFIKTKLDNPGISNTEAAARVYDANSRGMASLIGNRNMQNPGVVSALAKHNDLFESVIVKTAQDWMDSEVPRKREISLNAAMFGSDKATGKATVRIQQETSIVKINIDLSGGMAGEPPSELLSEEAN